MAFASWAAGNMAKAGKRDLTMSCASSDRVDAYREKLSDLLGPTFSTPNAPCTCYATVLQDCIAQAALASFGQPSKNPSRKVDQSWYDLECKHAKAALKLTPKSSEQFASKLKAHKQLTRRKRRIWQQKAQRELCELASRNPRPFGANTMYGKRTVVRSPERLGRPLSNPCTKLLTLLRSMRRLNSRRSKLSR